MSARTFWLVVLAACVGLVAGIAALSASQCHRRWSRSGMRAEWAPVQGCTIETSSGRWIPDHAYRELP